MKKMIRNLWILSMVLFSTSNLIAQEIRSTDVRTQGYYTLGLNTGFSYLSSDVKNVYDGYGVGLTLAKNLYYQPGAPFAFDARGRLLFDESYGLGFEKSFAIENNDALNGTGKLDYTTEGGSSGFVFDNHRTRMIELGVEGVLHFNRLRERTRFDLSLYGGIGLDWYKVKTDQQNSSGNYDYSTIDTDANKSTIRTQLKNNILDGVYETNAHDFKNGGKLGLMPGVGFDLEYNLTKRFSIGVGHKITFPRNDNLDGQLWNSDNTVSSSNDLHHYTNLDLRWILTPYQKKLKAPIIEVTSPSISPHTAKYCEGDVRARIKYVKNAADVDFKVNGIPTPYQFRGEKFTANFPLKDGRNEVRIYATNEAGSDQETVIIFCKEVSAPPPPSAPPVVYAPSVRITSPSYNDYKTSDPTINIKATIQNIKRNSDIEFFVNGYRKDFNYNASTSRLNAQINLSTGRNIVKIIARNSAGEAQDDRTIILGNKEVRYPSVNIKSPSANPYETTGNRVNVSANTTHIDRKSDIDFIVNGRATSDFTFNTSREKIEATVFLQEGRNTIEIQVENGRGKAEDQTTVIYVVEDEDEVEVPNPSGLKPIVEFTRPTKSSSSTSTSTATIKAFVKKVDSKNDIDFTLNGSPFNFTYNKSSQIVMATVPLKLGRNTVEISGQNSYGTTEETVSIRYATVVNNIAKKPNVNIKKPNNNSTTTKKQATVKAKVKEVSGKSEINLTLNGSNVSNFTYNKLTKELVANVTLNSGINTIKVIATNDSGTDTDQVKVTLKNTVSKPVVKITSPKKNSTTKNKLANLKSTITNVGNKSDIKVTLNGKNITDFSYSNGTVSTSFTLRTGKNTIKVKGSNSAGSDEESVVVTYTAPSKPQPKPVITVSAPMKKTFKKAKINLKAKILNVAAKKNISLTVNGKSTDFNYSPATKLLKANVTLKAGSNNIVITATNAAGKAEEKRTYKHLAPTTSVVEKPTVKINSIGQPTADPFNPGPLRSTILATIMLVDSKSDISLRVNGKKVTDFTFDPTKGTLRHTFAVKEGTNSIRIDATNEAGTTLITKNHKF